MCGEPPRLHPIKQGSVPARVEIHGERYVHIRA